jgi:hypothetical protein
MKIQKECVEVIRSEVKSVIDQILSDDEFWSGGICHPKSTMLSQKELDRIEVRMFKLIDPIRRKYQR